MLQALYDAVHAAALTTAGATSLMHEAKVDIVTVPNLSEHLSSADTTAQLSARFAYAAAMKSINNLLLLGDGETWSRQAIDFGGLPEMVRCFLQVAAGAADIPVTRLLGQSPSGLSATGESDTRNYYDMIAARQELDLRPQLERLDRLMLRSAGLDPGALTFAFRPLWQLDAASAAAIALQKAQASQIYAGLGLWPAAVTARLVEAQLVEDGTYPNAAAVFAEGAAAADAVTDALPIADLSATGFALWLNQPRDPDGRWTAGGGTSSEPQAPGTADPPPGAPGPHAPNGTPIELAAFRRGRRHGWVKALGPLVGGIEHAFRRYFPEGDDIEGPAPSYSHQSGTVPSTSPLIDPDQSISLAPLTSPGTGQQSHIQPPQDAYDPDGPKALGKPGPETGYRDPKGGENWVPNPNGRGYGWQDDKGDVWVPTGQGGSAHGGPHWDVQGPRGRYRNVKPPKS